MNTRHPAASDWGQRAGRPHSHLFLVRLWKAEVAGGVEYRGNVRDVSSGAWRSFRDWSDVAAFMKTQLEETEDTDTGQADQDAYERSL